MNYSSLLSVTSICEMLEVIYQTRETVFHRDTQTPRRELKTDEAQRGIFDEIRCVWIPDETLSREFNLSSQSKQKLNMNGTRSNIVKIYAY